MSPAGTSSKKCQAVGIFCLVPGTGLEPARLTTHPPQGCLSTNFNTRAFGVCIILLKLKLSSKNSCSRKSLCIIPFLLLQLPLQLLFLLHSQLSASSYGEYREQLLCGHNKVLNELHLSFSKLQ